MAHQVRQSRVQTDPFPLRHIAPERPAKERSPRERPLTEAELHAMYGQPQSYSDRGPKWGPGPFDRASPPGVVRPADWDGDTQPEVRSDWGQSGPSAWDAPPPVPVYDYVHPVESRGPFEQPPPWIAREPQYAPRPVIVDDEEIGIPLRRSRWALVMVALVLAAAGVVLAYALVQSGAVASFTQPDLTMVDDATPVDRDPIELGGVWVAVPTAVAEPNRGPRIEALDPDAEAEAEEPAAKAAPVRRVNRTYTYQRPRAAPAPPPPTATPYPDLDGDLGGEPSKPAPEPEPQPEPPSDLQVPDEYKQAPAPEAPSDI